MRTGALAALVLALGCSSGSTGNAPPPPPPPPPAVVASVAVSPGAGTLLVDATSQLTATPKTADGTPVAGQAVTWSSSPATVATVSSTGLVTAFSPGTATISARVGGITGTASVTVTRPPLTAFLSRPFDGDFTTINTMDHDTPQEFIDPPNGNHIAFWGEDISAVDTHAGFDYTMPIGTPLRSAAAGTVLRAESTNFFCPIVGHNVDQIGVIIEHNRPGGYKLQTYYAHLSTLAVTVGQIVSTGTPIGLSGNTGCTTTPHLHFQVNRVNLTNDGQSVPVDPYGWTGTAPDPWKVNPRGAESVNLWLSGQAPKVLVGFNKITTPFNGPLSGPSPKAVGLTTMVYTGPNEATDPNSEFLELEIDPTVQPAGSFDLTGSYLRNNAGIRYDFPAGTMLQQGQTLRLYVGSGVNSANTLYWGRSAAIFANKGDCVQLHFSGGGYYLMGYEVGCT